MKVTLTPTNARKLRKLVKYWNQQRAPIGVAPTDPDDLANLLIELEHDNQFSTPRYGERLKGRKR